MVELLQPPYDQHLRALCQEAKEQLDIVSPWVTGEGAALVPEASGRTCRLLFRGRAMDFLEGSTELDAIEALRRRGFQLFWRHDLHAKVYLTERAAIIGSANLTRNGMMEGNLEVAVRVEGAARDQLAEQVSAWFAGAGRVGEGQLRAVQRWCEEMKDRGERLLAERARMKQATPREIGAPAGKRRQVLSAPELPDLAPIMPGRCQIADTDMTRRALNKVVAQLPSPEFMEEIMARLGAVLPGLRADDIRLFASIGRNQGLSLSIGRRCVWSIGRTDFTDGLAPNPEQRPRLDLILPAGVQAALVHLPDGVLARQQDGFRNKHKGGTSRGNAPLWISFFLRGTGDLPAEIWDAWRAAVAAELYRSRLSGLRNTRTHVHHPALLEWAQRAAGGLPRAW